MAYYATYLWRGIGQTPCSFEHVLLHVFLLQVSSSTKVESSFTVNTLFNTFKHVMFIYSCILRVARHECSGATYLFNGLIMSKIMYALPAFAGQLTANDRNRIGAISRKAQRRGVSHTAFDIDELMDSVDRKLFTHITKPSHCLHHLLPSKTSAHCSYSLCKRQHCYQLPHIEYSQYKNSFINRCLFNFR